MRKFKKSFVGLSVVALTTAMFVLSTGTEARPPLGGEGRGTHNDFKKFYDHSGGLGLQSSSGYGSIGCETTGFEATEGGGIAGGGCEWEAGYVICGSTYDPDGSNPTCVTGAVTSESCTGDPLIDGNCCVNFPNPLNGWYMSATGMHCNEPHVETANPAGGSGQHIRFDTDPARNNTSYSSAHRQSLIYNIRGTDVDFEDGGPPWPPVTPATVDVDIAVTGSDSGSMRIWNIGSLAGFGWATVDEAGYVFARDYYGDLSYHYLGPITGSGVYDHLNVFLNPCRFEVTWTWNDNAPVTLEGGDSFIDRTFFNYNNGGDPQISFIDIDNFAVVRGTECVAECGNDFVEPGEECDGIVDDNCPGACIAPGATGADGRGECLCEGRLDHTIANCNPDEVFNGTTVFTNHGGFLTYTADSPFIGISTCDSDFDTEIYFDWDPECGEFQYFNDECLPTSFGGYQTPGDPLSPCSFAGGCDCISVCCPGVSCMCVPTRVGEAHTILVDEYGSAEGLPALGGTMVVNIDKRVTCEEVLPEGSGACCDRLSGTCSDVADASACDGDNMVFSAGKICDWVTCDAATGACCNSGPGLGGACERVTLAECDDADPQITWTKDTDCADAGCVETPGCCCNLLTGDKTPGVLAAGCTGTQRVWTKGSDCSDVTCTAVLGACCDSAVGGDVTVSSCTRTTQAGCAGAKQVWHKLALCEEIECYPNFDPIPTVSEWGMAILALLLLVAGKVYFGRRQAATA